MSGLSVEYTDVVYSADGTQVTLYLDGVGVPVTQSQRALTTDMAKMSHDFYEVVFLAKKPDISDEVARATWEIGQSAGINGIYGANLVTGYQYVPTNPEYISVSYGCACLFVGRKVDKTLLAVGIITQVTNADGTTDPYRITSSTKSVTFTVSAIETFLDINYSGNDFDKTSFVTAAGDNNNNPPYMGANPSKTIVEEVSLGEGKYPYYKLPKTNDPVMAIYFLKMVSSNDVIRYYIRIRNDPDGSGSIKPEVIKREPRFLSGGRYYYVQQAKLDTGTKIYFRANEDPSYAYQLVNNNPVYYFVFGSAGIHFVFDTSNSQGGIFSFTFRIPVYNITRVLSTNGGGSFTTWYIQPGFGRDLWSLDNGKDAGGCILMGTEDFGDWMDIFTAGMPW